VRAFYAHRHNEPAWIERNRVGRLADVALGVLRAASRHGLSPDDYGLSDFEQARATPEAVRLPDFELRVSAALLSLGRDVAIGTSDPQSLDGRWQHARRAPNLAATLAKAISSIRSNRGSQASNRRIPNMRRCSEH